MSINFNASNLLQFAIPIVGRMVGGDAGALLSAIAAPLITGDQYNAESLLASGGGLAAGDVVNTLLGNPVGVALNGTSADQSGGFLGNTVPALLNRLGLGRLATSAQAAFGGDSASVLGPSIDSLVDPSIGKDPTKMNDKELLKYQEEMQRYNRLITFLTNLLMMKHEASKAIIQNLRA